ncbi:hypothetical protein ABZW18_13700 [Streptomyces sp. NPDC004647]|uniref:hypothetical protein n=1 Tax=Streptomyces sp. NPDC004647 TaxID=3154671 RepID=UPI0033B3D677
MEGVAAESGRRSARRGTDGLDRIGHGSFIELLDDYAEACERIAEADLTYVERWVQVDDLVESVVGTVLGDAMLSAIRRLARVNASAHRYGDVTQPQDRAAPQPTDGIYGAIRRADASGHAPAVTPVF